MSKLHIDHLMIEAQRATEQGAEAPPFWMCGPKGILECRWLDPHFGFVEVEGRDGFFMAKQIAEHDPVLAREKGDAELIHAGLADLCALVAEQ